MPYIPPELISDIVAFTADANFSERPQLPLKHNKLGLSPLSLVSRTWLTASRRELNQRCRIVITSNYSPDIPDLCDILESRDRLPNLPHILSFISTLTLELPFGCSESTDYPQQVITLLDNLAKRQEFFQPKELYVLESSSTKDLFSKGCPSHPSRLITAISEAFSTITILYFDTPAATNCCSNLNYLFPSFKHLQEIQMMQRDVALMTDGVAYDGSLRIYRLPEGLHTFDYEFSYTLQADDYIQRTLDSLRSHPPLRQMRRLSFTRASPDRWTIMQAFVNMCPNLDMLCIFYNSMRSRDGPVDGLDLGRIEQLDRLCIIIPNMSQINPIDEEDIWKTTLLTLQTATSLSSILDIVTQASNIGESALHWWTLLSEAIAALPKQFVFKLRVTGAEGLGDELANKKREDFIREIFGKLSKRRRVLFFIEGSPDWSIGRSLGHFFEAADKCTWKSVEAKEE